MYKHVRAHKNELLNKLIIFFLLSIILGCNSQKNELEFEKEVFNEIFLELIDSTFYDFRTMQPPLVLPPLPNGIVISESQKKENIRIHEEYLAEFEKRKIKIEKDTARIVLAIIDTIFTLDKIEVEKFIIDKSSNYLILRLPDYDFLPFMAHGEDRIWLRFFLQLPFQMIKPLKFLTMEILNAISPMLMIL